MAATNPPCPSFTITQPFLGAPLQFQPALGSNELEQLVDAYVVGSASKQDKLSAVTIDFYNNATVDLNTGALVRRYDVFPSPWLSFEQSPAESQSSGFSPPIYTPSPGSSATLGDSAYGSVSRTPPNRARNVSSRASKKPKKDTRKTAEVRLPGFSIMTKDGVDVTNSASRGTKTKEQREHAHLMRIIKACDDCKKKKIRCDPSHRRQQTNMSRTSTSTTKTSSSSSSSGLDPGPTVSVPSLSQDSTQGSIPSYSNAIDDFILFPEDASSWNPADMALPELETQDSDLSQFNFDINDIDLNEFPPMNVDQSFDFDFFSNGQASGFQQFDDFLNYSPVMPDQYGYDEWASPDGHFAGVSHTRPHHATMSQDSGQLDANVLLADSPSSLQTNSSSSAEGYYPDGSSLQPRGSLAYTSPLSSSALDWNLVDSDIITSVWKGRAPSGQSYLQTSHQAEEGTSPRISQSENSRQEWRSRMRTSYPPSNERYIGSEQDQQGLSQSQSQRLGVGESRTVTDAFDLQRRAVDSYGSLHSDAGSGGHTTTSQSLQLSASVPGRVTPRFPLLVKQTEQTVERLNQSLQTRAQPVGQFDSQGPLDNVFLGDSFSPTNPFSIFAGLRYLQQQDIGIPPRPVYQEDASMNIGHTTRRHGVHTEHLDIRQAISSPHPKPSPLEISPTTQFTAFPLTAMVSQHVGSSRDTPLPHGGVALSRGAIPRTAVDAPRVDSSITVPQLEQLPRNDRRNYNLLLVCLGFLTSLAALRVLASSVFAGVLFPLVAIQTICGQWIDNSSPFLALTKLTLCCCAAAITPSWLFDQVLNNFQSLAAVFMLTSSTFLVEPTNCEARNHESCHERSDVRAGDLNVGRLARWFEPVTVPTVRVM